MLPILGTRHVGCRGRTELQHRIRAAAIVIQDNRILLVKHKHPVHGIEWWVPPGGGLKGTESIFECAARETWEETGLCVELDRIAYIRQFADVDQDTHHLEVFLLAVSSSGSITMDNLPDEPNEEFVQGVEFFSRDEIQQLTVYPEMLKNEFWEDLRNGFSSTRYLGVQRP